ncbi:ribbon-helix-helix domain-containing protein [Natronosalvus rutilus]|uniref:Ribbon-helix-helix domain-containing protein n=1 Tax=Natronosalvus rutilus TaxID=2953753 RepID=A0A9E7NF67_9EURY|nr:ribbon-helix-helix domain-containing protein [Natronosalvus rutilus]UTF55879.1 ribbon-helix-helix domain-containing protein [Natronosalvus rutilus]
MASQSSNDVIPEPAHSRLETRQTLDRVTFRATDEQLEALESLVDADIYHIRSQAIRAGIQRLLEEHAQADVDHESR